MKKLILSLVAIATISLSSFGQAPEGFKYQAVVRDAGNTILNNQSVGMQMTIQQGSIGGTVVYTETFSPTSNAYGLVNIEIGSGNTTDDFSTIDWSAGPYFIETAMDATGGTAYVVMGTSQLRSVPYALYAKTSGNGQGPVGPQGPAGTDGTNGTNGNDGATGPQGLTGNDGAQGLTGPQGPAGADGTNGTNGTDGATGLTGPAGADGQGGVIQAGTNVTITGTGIGIDPYVVNTADDELQPFGTEGQILTMVGGVPTWVTPSCGLSIGDWHAGGIIFYLDGTGCSGLVAAPTDLSTGAEWGCYGIAIAGADGTAIGTGYQNTIDIEAGCSAPGTAADLCSNYTDWFLPSRDELNLMYQNIGPGNALGLGNVGGFANAYYWSSTVYNVNAAWLQGLFNGYQGGSVKTNTLYVRAVRAF